MIKIIITGDTAAETMKSIFELAQGVFSTYDHPPTPEEVQAAGSALHEQAPAAVTVEKAEPAPPPKPAPAAPKAAEPKPAEPKPAEPKPAPAPVAGGTVAAPGEDTPFSKFGNVVKVVTAEKFEELKRLSADFLQRDPANRAKLAHWMKENNVSRLSELPEPLVDSYTAMVKGGA